MITKYRIYWDNGYSACGTFPHLVFDSEAEAKAAADRILAENLALDVWDDQATVEVMEFEEMTEDEREEAAAIEEQSLDYFNRYIAGDRR
jgi:hypothetical protein